MVYETLLLVGVIGLAAQAVLGFSHGHDGVGSHGGHTGHTGHVGHAGHSHVGATEHGAHHGHAGNGNNGNQEPHGATGKHGVSPWLAWLSPLTLCSLCLGAGATGLAVRGAIAQPLIAALVAALGAAVFYGLMVRPLWTLIFGFASRPAETLSGVVAQEVEATGSFDAQGRGIVRAIVDGEVVRLLAHLDTEDRAKGVTIAPGEKVVVTEVDRQRNTVRVTRL